MFFVAWNITFNLFQTCWNTKSTYLFCRFVELIEPDEQGRGWRAKVEPANEFIDNYEFKCLIIAAGKKVPIEGK